MWYLSLKLIIMRMNDLQSEFRNVIIEADDIDFGLTINSVGYKSILPDVKKAGTNKIKDYKFHYKVGRVSDEYKLIYITKGTGFICFDEGCEHEISKGKILLIYPNQKYTYYHLPDTEWKEYFVRFEADSRYNQLIKKYFPGDILIADIGFSEELVKLFNRAIDVVKNGLKSSQVYLSGILFHMLGLIISESRNKTLEKKQIQEVEQAKIIMNELVYENVSIEEVASRLGISYPLFRKNFKKFSGESPAKFFNDLKLNKAKQLMLETPHSIKEISYMLGYSSNEHFSTTFKKATGLTPKDFRTNELNRIR